MKKYLQFHTLFLVLTILILCCIFLLLTQPGTAERPSETYQIPLKFKWNLFSIPVDEIISFERITIRNNSIDYNWTEAISEGIIIGILFEWENEIQNYITTGENLEPGIAYWIWVNYPCFIRFQSNIIGDGQIRQMTTRWNMMGLPYNETLPKEHLLVDYNATQYSWINATSINNEENHSLILSYFYEWNSTTQLYNLASNLDPGNGYWMYAYYNLSLCQQLSLPQISDNTPNVVGTGDSVVCNVSVSDPDGVQSVWMEYWFNEGASVVEQMSPTGVSTFYENTVMIPTDSLEPLYYIIHARDTKTIWNSTTERTSLVVDNDPPEIISVTASPPTAEQGNVINISCTATDNIALAEVYVRITYPDDSLINITMQDQFYYTAIYTMVGEYLYNIWAKDSSGNNNLSSEYSFGITTKTCTITATAEPGGIIIPIGAISVVYDHFQNFSITPDDGYHIADVLVDTVSIGPVSWYNFTNVIQNHTINAMFDITNQAPTHNTPILVSEFGTNTSQEPLLCMNQSTADAEGDIVTNTYRWRKNNISLTTLLFSFNTENSTTVRDYSETQNHATVNLATWENNGKVGGAYNFNGASSYLQVPADVSLDGNGTWSEMTLEYWVYLNTDQTSKTLVAKYGGTGVNERSYLMYISSTTNKLFGAVARTGNNYIYQECSTILTKQTWYHVVMVYKSGDGLRMYLNGQLEGAKLGYSGNIQISPEKDLYIGCRYGNQAFLDGLIDELHLYPIALTPQQIYQNYNDSKDGLSSLSTIVKEHTSIGDVWDCDVTPSDGAQDGITKTSNALTIIPVYTLTITTSGSGVGSVEVSPSGPYYTEALVVLWANASNGSMFSGWSGALTGNHTPETLLIDGNKTINAEFSSTSFLSINASYDSASIGSYTINGNQINLSLNTEQLVNSGAFYTYWMNFKVQNTLNKNITFRITNADLVPFLTNNTHEVHLVYSYDGLQWVRLTNYTYSTGTYRFWKNFTENQVQIATFFPFSYTEMQQYLQNLNASQYTTITNLGKSVQNRNITLLTITNPAISNMTKKIIYIIGRQHSAETTSSHMLKGLIDFLISEDSDARRLRDSFIWNIVPMVNPDGVALGYTRGTSLLRDPNDDWSNSQSLEINIVRAHLSETKNTTGVDFFIDWHSHISDIRWYNYIYSPPGNTFFSLLSEWTDFDEQESPGVGSSSARGYATNLGIFTFTFEPTPHLSTWTLDALHEQGEKAAQAIDEYFPLLLDSEFNESNNSQDLRAYTGNDWYESRNNDPLLVALDTNNIAGNLGKKAGFFTDDITHYTYLSQEFKTRQTGRFTVSLDIYVDSISIYYDNVSKEAYNRTGCIFIGSDDADLINGPCTTSNERFVFLSFFDPTPGEEGSDIILKARESLSQPWANTTLWTTIQENLSYDTWYRLSLDVDMQTRTYTVYINDVLAAQNISGYGNYISDSVSHITFYAGGTARGTFYIDNVFSSASKRHQIHLLTQGNGVVSKTPGESSYKHGSPVILTATAASGWSFDHWAGDFSGINNPVNITPLSDMTITAIFTQDEYIITTNTTGNGLITILPSQPTYHYNDIVEVHANPEAGWFFTHWTGALGGHTTPVLHQIIGNSAITAHFSDSAEFTLTLNTIGKGLVINDPDRAFYEPEATVILTAIGNPGWNFTKWIGDIPSGHDFDNPLLLTMNANKILTASFNSSEPTVMTEQAVNITSISATLQGNIIDTGGENCSVWFEWDYSSVEECMGTIATGIVCKDGRSILHKNRHYYYDNVKPYYYQGDNYSYFGIGDAEGQCRMGQNEKGLAIVNMDVGGTIINWKYQSDWASGSQDNDAKICLGSYSTVQEAAYFLAHHGYYYGNGSTNGQYLIISSEPGVGAIVAIDRIGHTNITWINNTYAGCANSWYCDKKWDTGDYNDLRAKRIMDDIVINGTSSDGDHLLNWQDIAQRVAKDTSDLQKGWSSTAIDTSGNKGMYTSIALDTTNKPYITYHDESNGDLRYVRWTGSSWSATTVDSTGDTGEFTSLVLDTNNYPHISYYDRTNGNLRYAKWDGSTWSRVTVDSTGDVGKWTSLALDTNNNPAISYYDGTNGYLKYAKSNGTAWDIQTVDTAGVVGEYTSLALDSTGNSHISYYDSSMGALKYAVWNGTAWTIETVDSTDDTGQYTSLALDTLNRPHISYFDATNNNLKYSKWVGSSWLIDMVDSLGDVGSWTSLILDSSNHPYISYYDSANFDVKLANHTGPTWEINTIHTFPKDGQYTSITLDSTNKPHFAYYDETNADLKYVKWIQSYSYAGQIATSYSRSSTVHVGGNQSLNSSIHMSWLGIGQTTQVCVFLPLYAGNLHSIGDIPSNFTMDNGGKGIQPYADVKRDYARGNLPNGNFYCSRVSEILRYANANENLTFNAFDSLLDTIMLSADEQEARMRLDVFMETMVPKALRGYIKNSTKSSTDTYKRFPQGIGVFSETITDLDPGTIYYVKAWANNTGSSSNGSIQRFMTKPESPSKVQAVFSGETQVNISWTKGTGAFFTVIERNLTSGNLWERGEGVLIYNGTGKTCVDTTVTSGVEYYYRLWSYTTEKGFQQFSDTAALGYTGSNMPPVILNPVPSNGASGVQINLTELLIDIQDPEGDLFNWSIQTSPYIGNSTGLYEGNGTKTCTITSLTYGVTYKWFVNTTDGTNSNNKVFIFTTKVGILVDPDFNASLDSADLRNNSIGQDWYESRGAFGGGNSTLLSLDTTDIGGNNGKKAGLKSYGIPSNAYLTQEFGAIQTAPFSVSFDIYVDRIEDSSNYDRTGLVYIGSDSDTANCPTGTSNERFVHLTFYDPTPGDTGEDIEIRARTSSTQPTSTTSSWTLVATDLHYDIWYTIKVVIFPSDGTYNVYVNGQLKGYQLSKYSGYPLTTVAYMSFSADSEGRGDFYIDNVLSVPFANNPPVISEEHPMNNTTGVSILTTNLSVIITDADDDPVSYTIETSPDVGNTSGTGTSDTYICNVSGLAYGMTYTWFVNVTDAESWTRNVFSFTTETAPVNDPPVFSIISPGNNSHGIPYSLTSLSLTIQDPEGDSFNWSIQTLPDIGSYGVSNDENGTKYCMINGLVNGTTYAWFVNASDAEGSSRKTFYFSVQDGLLSDPDFNDSISTIALRNNTAGSFDWYESRNDNPAYLILHTDDVGGNSGKKAGLICSNLSGTAYLSQEFSTTQTGSFNVSVDIYVDCIYDNGNYDRTAHIFIGNDIGGTQGPCSTGSERFVCLAFYDANPNTNDNDIFLKARQFSNQSFGTTSQWTSLATSLSYDTWYTIRLEIKSVNGTYDVYLDDILVGSNIQKQAEYTSTSITHMSFYVGGYSRGDFYVDNVFCPTQILPRYQLSDGDRTLISTSDQSSQRLMHEVGGLRGLLPVLYSVWG